MNAKIEETDKKLALLLKMTAPHGFWAKLNANGLAPVGPVVTSDTLNCLLFNTRAVQRFKGIEVPLGLPRFCSHDHDHNSPTHADIHTPTYAPISPIPEGLRLQ
jgi:hypothetical protein